MPFQKGNKHGRGRPPAGKSLSEALRVALAEKLPDGRTNYRAIADTMVKEAREGNVSAFNAIADRIEGKVPTPAPTEANTERPIQIMMYPEDLKTM